MFALYEQPMLVRTTVMSWADFKCRERYHPESPGEKVESLVMLSDKKCCFIM